MEILVCIVVKGWPGDQTLCKGREGSRSPVVCDAGPQVSPWGSSGEPGSMHDGPKRPVLDTPALISHWLWADPGRV